MRKVNFQMLTLMKICELLFLIIITIVAVVKVSLLMTTARHLPTSATLPSPILLPLILFNISVMFFHTMHVNLFVNVRLSIAKNRGGGWNCCWKPINWLICKFGRANDKWHGLQYFCRDRCLTWITLTKYMVVLPIFLWPGLELMSLSSQFKEQALI